jgi:hypothetical protein
MLITKTSQLTGKTHTLDIPVTEHQLSAWKTSGKTIQSVLPHLTADEREFILTGVTTTEWNNVFSR